MKWCHTLGSIQSRNCRMMLSSSSWEADIATRKAYRISHGRHLGRQSQDGRAFRRSATSSTTTSNSDIPTHATDRTASDAHRERVGVCRDFAHLAITLCRCMNIPARYCTGYLGDIGVPAGHGANGFQRLVRGLSRWPLAHFRCPAQPPSHRSYSHRYGDGMRRTSRSRQALAQAKLTGFKVVTEELASQNNAQRIVSAV